MSFLNKVREKLPQNRRSCITLLVFAVVALLGAIMGGIFVSNFISRMTILNLPGEPVGQPSSTEETDSPMQTISNLPAASVPLPEPWDGTSRVNLLFMGLDYRDWEAGEIPRTDTMILFTLDPLNKTAGMVSIPRDLWVTIPGFENERINVAYRLGELYKLPGGGPGLAMRTVEQLLGVPIQYYAQIDFQAFVSFIDRIEGVKIDIPDTILVDPIGDAPPVHLEPGVATLPGDLALAYARARNTKGVDFDRAMRQQQVILGVMDRILEFNMMPRLIANANLIYGDLSSGIHTNLDLNQAIRLALKVLEVPRDEIKHVIINNEYVSFATTPEGWQILKAIPDKIRLLRDEVFSSGIAFGPAAVANDLLELVKLENASVSISNGSSHSGLAASTAEYLRGLGVNVVEETNTDYTVYSQIYLYGSRPYTLKYLVDMISIPTIHIYNRYDPAAQLEIIVVLGDDWANNNPMP